MEEAQELNLEAPSNPATNHTTNTFAFSNCIHGLGGEIQSLDSLNKNDKQYLVSVHNQQKTPGKIRLWNFAGDCLNQFVAHQGLIQQVRFIDSEHFASVSFDKSVRIWTLTGDLVHSFEENDRFYCLAAHPTEKVIAAGQRSGVVRFFDYEKKEQCGLMQLTAYQVQSLAFSVNGTLIAAGLSGECTQNLIISNVNDGAQVAALAAHSDSVMGLVFSADDKLLASASEDLSVKLWSQQGNQFTLLHAFEGAHKECIYSLAFSPDSRTLASCSEDHLIKLWDAQQLQFLDSLQHHKEAVYGVAWLDNNTLASSSQDKSIIIWKRTIQ